MLENREKRALEKDLYRGNICIHAKKRELRTIEVMIARQLLWIYTLDSPSFLIRKTVLLIDAFNIAPEDIRVRLHFLAVMHLLRIHEF